MHLRVPLDARIDTLFEHDLQRLVQRVSHVDRRRVVIDASAATTAARIIFPQHRNVEIPRLHLRLARIHAGERAVAKRHRRKSRRTAQAFLRAAVERVDAPRIHVQLVSAQTSDGIDQQQRPARVNEIRETRERLVRARARLCVNDADEFHLRMRVERRLDLLQRNHVAPRRLDRVDGRAAALHHILHARAEYAVDAHDHLVARLDEIDRAAFHAGHARAADGKREPVFRAHHLAEHRARVIHDREILRIEMPQRGRRHRAKHALRHRARTGPEEDAFVRDEGGGGVFHDEFAMIARRNPR